MTLFMREFYSFLSLKRALTMAGLTVLTLLAHGERGFLAAAQAPPDSALPFQSSQAYGYLKSLVEFGPRPSGSASIDQAREYLVHQSLAMGYQVHRDHFDANTPGGIIPM